ncbi:9813_t:CDS:2, partial [Racocetra persica]
CPPNDSSPTSTLAIDCWCHLSYQHVTSIYPQKRIYVPDTPFWKAAVIAICSITLALLTMRFGV